jgi:RNA polymerase II elongation factor ELL
MPLPVAVNGTISLQGLTRQGVSPQPLAKRAMIIRMSEETLEALAAYPNHPPLQFQFGDTPVRASLTYISFLPHAPLSSGYPHCVDFLPHERRPGIYSP